jgi:hypothetical protein
MISRNGFAASSSWHIKDASDGAISLRWKAVDDSIKAELYQYASLVDRNAKRKMTTFAPSEAYDRIIAAVGRFIDPQLAAYAGDGDLASVPLKSIELPADFDPDKLNFGKSIAVEGFAIRPKDRSHSILIITSIAGPSDKARNAEVVQLDRTISGWIDVPVGADAVEVLAAHSAAWVKRTALAMAEEVQTPAIGM